VTTGRVPSNACPLCPRLVEFRERNRKAFPGWHNAPVPSFVGDDPHVLVVGLAPGLRGANRTGRPFTGDYAGDLLYPTLLKYGFARGSYEADPDDGLTLDGATITNAVRCVPPENKPTPAEVRTCGAFLRTEISGYANLKVILALGRIAHDATLRALGLRLAAHPFGHGAVHVLPSGLRLVDSYHCSRYNTNTGRLTPAMFEAVFATVRGITNQAPALSPNP